MSLQDEINIIQYLLDQNVENDGSYEEHKYLLSIESYLAEEERS